METQRNEETSTTETFVALAIMYSVIAGGGRNSRAVPGQWVVAVAWRDFQGALRHSYHFAERELVVAAMREQPNALGLPMHQFGPLVEPRPRRRFVSMAMTPSMTADELRRFTDSVAADGHVIDMEIPKKS